MVPSLSELFERLVHLHIHSSLEGKKLLSERNSGFRKKTFYSTVTPLLETTRKLYSVSDKGLASRIVLWIFLKTLIG